LSTVAIKKGKEKKMVQEAEEFVEWRVSIKTRNEISFLKKMMMMIVMDPLGVLD